MTLTPDQLEGLRRIRSRRRRTWLTWVATLAALYVASRVLPVAIPALAVIGFAAFLVATIRYSAARCPRCGELFNVWKRWAPILRPQCRHCGLRLASPALVAFVLLAGATGALAGPAPASDADELRALHAKVMRAHRESKIDILMEDEAPDYVIANRGKISGPTLDQRRNGLGPYLRSTAFSEYRDMVEPVVKVSADGTLGWVVVQVQARGVQTSDAGKKEPVEFQSAWIELYEKRQGRWLRVGNVSNFKEADGASPALAPITTAGWGPVRVGMSVADVSRALGGDFAARDSAIGCHYRSSAKAPGLLFMIENGRVVRVETKSRAFATPSGVRVGDTEAAAMKSYGGRARVTPHKYSAAGHYLTIPTSDGKAAVVIETDGSTIVAIRGGRRPAVEYVEGRS
jgi:hypothetical protein